MLLLAAAAGIASRLVCMSSHVSDARRAAGIPDWGGAAPELALATTVLLLVLHLSMVMSTGTCWRCFFVCV